MKNQWNRLMICSLVGSVGLAAVGCSKLQGFMEKDKGPKAHVFVSLDGLEAKAVRDKGYAEIKQPVSLSPTLRYRIRDKADLGRISSVIGNIFVQFGDSYSSQAEYIIMAKDMNNPDKQLKPDTDYPLGNPPAEMMIHGRDNQEFKSLKLQPNTKYRMTWVVSADKSETAIIEFRTK